MEIIFRSETREYKATVESVEEIYEAVKDGMIAMSYAKTTSEDLMRALK